MSERECAVVVSDKSGIRQLVLHELGFRTLSVHHDLHSRGHYDHLRDKLAAMRPKVMWIRLAGPCAGSGNKRDSQRTMHLCNLAEHQLTAQGILVLEANARSQAWHLKEVQALTQKLFLTEHVCCRYEGGVSKGGVPCNTVIRMFSNVRVPDGSQCVCPPGRLHVPLNRIAKAEADERWLSVMRGVVALALQKNTAVMAVQHKQPESIIPDREDRDVECCVAVQLKRESESVVACNATRVQHEELCRAARSQADFSFETCLQLLQSASLKGTTKTRRATVSDAGHEVFVFGLYSYGAEVGITRRTEDHHELVLYLNSFMTFHGGSGAWSSIAVNDNVRAKPHRDHNNAEHSSNQIIGIGNYKGGELWFEIRREEVDRLKNVEWMISDSGDRIPGKPHNCRHRLMRFSPELLHCTLPWQGNRVCITSYLNKGISVLSASERKLLINLGFRLQSEFSYPTEGALRYKELLKAGHVPKTKRKVVEVSHDDCGESLDSILPEVECVSWEAWLMGSVLESPIVQVPDAVVDQIFVFTSGCHRWMHGSNADCCLPELQKRGTLSPQQLRAAFASGALAPTSDDQYIQCAELFGGSGSILFLLVKVHGLKSGLNFDVTAGFDLNRAADVQVLLDYVRCMRPLVVLLFPSCKSFGHSGRANRGVTKESWVQSRIVGETLAAVCLQVAKMQFDASRHYLIEQPSGSELYKFKDWREFFHNTGAFRCVFDQCQTGLKAEVQPFLPIRKRTEVWTSAEILIRGLRDKQCAGDHQHAQGPIWNSSHHTSFGRSSQFWPLQLCDIMAASISDLALSSSQAYFPSDAHLECPGCRWHKRKTDPSHLRVGDCKYPREEPVIYECPGCKSSRPRDHSSHRLDDTCQWAVARSMPEGASRERTGGHPRDGRIPASAEPTTALDLELRIKRAGPLTGSAKSAPSASHGARRDAEVQVSEGGSGPLRAEPPRLSTRRRGEDRAVGEPARASTWRPEDDQAAAPPARSVDGRVSAEPESERADPAPVAADAPAAPAGDEAQLAEGAAADEDDWTKFDLGRSLLRLRSVRESIVRRTLRLLHIRWYHASAQKMKNLPSAAGVEPRVLQIVPTIVDTCKVCRAWMRTGPRSIASTRLPSSFNSEVQLDLLFFKGQPILHVIDVCTRFTAVGLLTGRDTDTILTGFQKIWVSYFGPPEKLVGDQEGGWASPAAVAWLQNRDITFVPKAKYSHAGVVERHNEIFRRQLHLLEAQTRESGMKVSLEAIIAESAYAKNALFRIGNATPYECVIGKVPPLFDILGHEDTNVVDVRDSERIRSKAIQAMLQATSESKTQRANKSKTRAAGEMLELANGDLVDFYREPISKDNSGWLGPATVIDLTQLKEGQLTVRWQGRAILCRVQDVRRALIFCSFLSVHNADSPISVLMGAAERYRGKVLRLGWFKNKGTWRPFEDNLSHPRVLIAGLHVAACHLQLTGTVSFRAGCAVNSLPGVHSDESLMIWWQIGKVNEWFHAFISPTKHTNCQRLFGRDPSDVGFVQFFSEDAEAILQLRQVVTDIPNVGGIHDPAMPRLRDVQPETKRRSPHALEDGMASDGHDEVLELSSDQLTGDTDDTSFTIEREYDALYAHWHAPEVSAFPAPECSFVITNDADEEFEDLSLHFDKNSAKYTYAGTTVGMPRHDDTLAVFASGATPAVIERSMNILSRAGALANAEQCRVSMIKELNRWHKHNAWQRMPRHLARNALQS